MSKGLLKLKVTSIDFLSKNVHLYNSSGCCLQFLEQPLVPVKNSLIYAGKIYSAFRFQIYK